jgi:hypothetical protein
MLASTSENSGFYIRGRHELQQQLVAAYEARRSRAPQPRRGARDCLHANPEAVPVDAAIIGLR